MSYNLFLSKQFVVSNLVIKEAIRHKLNLSEFLLLIYFINSDAKVFDIPIIKEQIGLDDKEILEAFNTLTTKKLITIEIAKDSAGHMIETISLEGFCTNMNMDIQADENTQKKENIFEIFEREFNRELTPMEYEIINAWLDNNTTEDLILGALKEATYNGVKSFRYIDKIIYEWGKKGFKTMEDVKNHINNKDLNEKKTPELFDYDWLDGND